VTEIKCPTWEELNKKVYYRDDVKNCPMMIRAWCRIVGRLFQVEIYAGDLIRPSDLDAWTKEQIKPYKEAIMKAFQRGVEKLKKEGTS